MYFVYVLETLQPLHFSSVQYNWLDLFIKNSSWSEKIFFDNFPTYETGERVGGREGEGEMERVRERGRERG